MIFPNAASGVKKIYIAAILTIVGVGLIGLATILFSAFSYGLTGGDLANGFAFGLTMSPFLGLASFCASAGAIVSLVAWVLQLIGVIQASKDSESFKTVLYLILIGIAVSLFGALFSRSAFFYTLFQIAGEVISLMISFMIINGINSMADSYGNSEIQRKGETVIRLMVITLGLSIAANLLLMIFGGIFGAALAALLALAMVVLHVIQLVLYMTYLSMANRMLAS